MYEELFALLLATLRRLRRRMGDAARDLVVRQQQGRNRSDFGCNGQR